MTRRETAPLCARMYATGAHPAVVEDIIDRGSIEDVLRDDARHFGTHEPGRDYTAEADALAPTLVRAWIAPAVIVRLDPATADEIAALHTVHPPVHAA